MLYDHEHIAELITRFNRAALTTAEKVELDEWIATSSTNKELFEELTDPEKFRIHFKRMETYDGKSGWELIRTEAGLPDTPVAEIFPIKKRIPAWRKMAIAASILLPLCIAAYLIFFQPGKKEINKADIVNKSSKQDVQAPDKTKATITLADGRVIPLDSLNTLMQGNVQLVKSVDGKLVYDASGLPTPDSRLIYNTLSNPRGSRVIDMQLADGSHVWLNAGSSVTYPISFVGQQREVQITGEAYFEIASDRSKPFIVSRGTTSVTVLGTHFNVKAFEDDQDLRVTLLEGSVRVSAELGTVTIRPRQQVKIDFDEKPSIINDVNLEEVMAWKNGMFSFENADLKSIMKELARWYDLDVRYASNNNEKFRVKISRHTNLSTVFKIMEETGFVKFRIEGKNITVQ